MSLTDVAIRAAKPRQKPYKLFDGRGLFLLINPTGSRLWRLKYRFEGREKLLALGKYPDVPLKVARDKSDDARRLIGKDVDPCEQRQAQKAARENTVQAVGEEWLAKQEKKTAATTQEQAASRLRTFVFPRLGSRPIASVKPSELLAVLRSIEARGKIETAHRVKSLCSRVWCYGVATDRAERDITADLREVLATKPVKHHAAITEPRRVGELLRAIDGYVGQPATCAALRLAPLLLVRPIELRAAEWAEIDLENAEWRIPAERMKMREEHLVPLATQAVAIFEAIREVTGEGKYVFPSLRSASRPLSDNTVNAALRRLGFSKDEMTGHGFRTTASTLLNEQGWRPDIIELQLAHVEKNSTRDAYNRAKRLTERRKMMQAWADYLDGLRASNNVVAIGAAR